MLLLFDEVVIGEVESSDCLQPSTLRGDDHAMIHKSLMASKGRLLHIL